MNGGGGAHRTECRINGLGKLINGSNNQRINVYAGAKEDDYLVDEELNAVIVEESKKGEKEREEEEQAEASARQNVASIRQGLQRPFLVSPFFLGKIEISY